MSKRVENDCGKVKNSFDKDHIKSKPELNSESENYIDLLASRDKKITYLRMKLVEAYAIQGSLRDDVDECVSEVRYVKEQLRIVEAKLKAKSESLDVWIQAAQRR